MIRFIDTNGSDYRVPRSKNNRYTSISIYYRLFFIFIFFTICTGIYLDKFNKGQQKIVTAKTITNSWHMGDRE